MKVLRAMLDPRLEVNIVATAQFVRMATADPLPPAIYQETFGYNMAVCPEIRSALLARTIDGGDALVRIRVPVLIVQGEKDAIVRAAAGDYIAAKVPHARKSCYPDVGHCPFIEDAARFNRELAAMRAALASAA